MLTAAVTLNDSGRERNNECKKRKKKKERKEKGKKKKATLKVEWM